MQPEFLDGIILSGGPVHAVRAELLRAGWQPERVVTAVHFKQSKRMLVRRLTQLLDAINPGAAEILLIGLENEHEPFANFVRRYVRKGTHQGLAWVS
jgi:hypothetical protein